MGFVDDSSNSLYLVFCNLLSRLSIPSLYTYVYVIQIHPHYFPPPPLHPTHLTPPVRPETELWIFSPAESPSHSHSHSPPHQPFCPTCKTAILSLTSHMATLPTPPMHPSNAPALALAHQHATEYPETGPSAKYPPSPGLYMRHLLQEKVVTFGAANTAVVDVLNQAGLLCKEYPGWDLALNKFFFKVADLPETRALPEGLRWGTMREEDLAVVQARTSIPRTTRTLMSLASVGVFEETGKPVAWTFLGLDGSLTTLHTEEEWRGKGIAKAVAVKIMREHAGTLAVDEEGNAWAHADVYVGNVQSESVCKSLGGRAGASILWCRIDIGRAKIQPA